MAAEPATDNNSASSASNRRDELTVCDIIGEWGTYQWSLTLFAVLYSSIISMTVTVGPLWTPNMKHVCLAPSAPAAVANSTSGGANGLLQLASAAAINFTGDVHECLAPISSLKSVNSTQGLECTEFIYDDENYGKLLTNTFDLVCSRHWMRSVISSSALTGMLLSSVSLGLLSDKYGRISCIRTGFWISILATIGAIFAQNYFLLNICILLMSYAQVGVANALSTLVMEATSPKWRFVPVFEYGFGWGLGLILAALLNYYTRNYQLFLLATLVLQLAMTLWLRWGVFESIRWLLSEGKINRAQIELQRACRINGVQNGAELAHKIAQVQVQQVRKASFMIAEKTAPARLARARHQEVGEMAQELGSLNAAIRRSFSLASPEDQEPNFDETLGAASVSNSNNNIHLGANHQLSGSRRSLYEETASITNHANQLSVGVSPTLNRKSFSLSTDGRHSSVSGDLTPDDALPAKNSITTQALIELTLKYSKTLHQQEEGSFILAKLFHKKLYKLTIILMLLSVTLESTYYGLIQASKFVGTNVNLNYVVGALSEWVAAIIYMLVLWAFSRRAALIAPTILSALVCLGIALTYHLTPTSRAAGGPILLDISGLKDELGSLVMDDNATSTLLQRATAADLVGADDDDGGANCLLELRNTINFWLMILGKLTVTVAMQTAATISMEAYPNNLRQTASGAIVLVGRIGSIVAPFLFNDPTEDKLIFKSTLCAIASIGILVSFLIPFLVRDTKNQELCDRLDEIKDS